VAYYLGWMSTQLIETYWRNEEAREAFRECLELYRRVGDKRRVARVLALLGWYQFELPDQDRIALLQEGVRSARAAGDGWSLACSLALAARAIRLLVSDQTSRTEQHAMLEEAIAAARGTGDPWILSFALHSMGGLYHSLDQHEAAEPWYWESLEIARNIEDKSRMISALHMLSDCFVARRMPGKARELMTEGVRLCIEVGARGELAFFLGCMAGVAMAEGKFRKGVRLIAAWWKITNAPWGRGSMAEFRAWSGLDEASFAAEVAAGEAMTLEQAVELDLSPE
jgi:tetratricopeptide (TPR) repeat protein